MYKCNAILLGILSVGTAWADDFDKLVTAEMRRQHIPGLSIAVVKDGKIIREQGFGLANVEHQVRVTPATIFQSGSIGKQFTSALVMLLVEDGKLKLDEPVAAYLQGIPPSWSTITVRHLLTHTSGLAAFNDTLDYRKDYTDAELLAAITKVPMIGVPGEQSAYSNLAYQVLGILCTRVGGTFYGDQLRERIFKPSGMHTRIISERDIVPHRSAGYDRYDGVLTNQSWVSPSINTTADGSLYLTARDLAHWSMALGGDKVLSATIKNASWTPAKLNNGTVTGYGFGWEVAPVNDHHRVQHSGAWQGFSSHITRFADDKLAVIVLANRSGAKPRLIADKIAAYYIPALTSLIPVAPNRKAIASVPMFIRGSMNNWGLVSRLRKTTDGIYEADIDLDAGQHIFKLASEDWNIIDFGSQIDEPIVTLGKAKAVDFKGGNFKLDVKENGRYVVRFDARQITQPSVTIVRQ